MSFFSEPGSSRPEKTPVVLPVVDLTLYLSPFLLIASIFFVPGGAIFKLDLLGNLLKCSIARYSPKSPIKFLVLITPLSFN